MLFMEHNISNWFSRVLPSMNSSGFEQRFTASFAIRNVSSMWCQVSARHSCDVTVRGVCPQLSHLWWESKGHGRTKRNQPSCMSQNPRWTFIWFWSRDELLMFKIYNLVSSHMGKPWCVFKSGEKKQLPGNEWTNFFFNNKGDCRSQGT